MALRGNFSSLVSATDPIKSLKDSASLVVCTLKIFFWLGCGFFVSDTISGGLVGHLDPLHLALGPQTIRWWNFTEVFMGN